MRASYFFKFRGLQDNDTRVFVNKARLRFDSK